MTARAVAWAWIGALVLTLALALGALALAPPRASFAGAPIAVIGSSVTRSAIAPSGAGESSLLGDGRAHRRIAPNAITEPDLLALADNAIDDGASVLVVEANPLLFTFNVDHRPRERECDSWLTALRVRAWHQQRRVSDPIRIALGALATAPELEAAGRAVEPEDLARFYPLHFRDPCPDRLERLARRAREHHVRIVIIVPPRSAAAHAVLGAAQARELEARARRLAQSLDAPLFMPSSPWSGDYFYDHAHMNAAGRQRFAALLKDWWRASE